jgi:hypothetical protein
MSPVFEKPHAARLTRNETKSAEAATCPCYGAAIGPRIGWQMRHCSMKEQPTQAGTGAPAGLILDLSIYSIWP